MAEAATSKKSTNKLSPAAKYNKRILKALQTALKKDPAADITSILPPYYSDKLSLYKSNGMSFSCRI